MAVSVAVHSCNSKLDTVYPQSMKYVNHKCPHAYGLRTRDHEYEKEKTKRKENPELYGHALSRRSCHHCPFPVPGKRSPLLEPKTSESLSSIFLSVNLFHLCPKRKSAHSYSDVLHGKARIQFKVTGHYDVLGRLGAMGEADCGKYKYTLMTTEVPC